MTGFATAFFSRGAFTKIFPRTYNTKTQFLGSKVVCSARRRRRKILSLFDLKTVSVGLIAGLEKTFSWGKGALGGAGRFFPGRGVFHLDPPGGHPLGAVANPGEGLKYFIKKYSPNYLAGGYTLPQII